MFFKHFIVTKSCSKVGGFASSFSIALASNKNKWGKRAKLDTVAEPDLECTAFRTVDTSNIYTRLQKLPNLFNKQKFCG